MKLFGLKDTHSNSRDPLAGWFASKDAAKRHRDELNAVDPQRYVVTPGPDHHRSHKPAK